MKSIRIPGLVLLGLLALTGCSTKEHVIPDPVQVEAVSNFSPTATVVTVTDSRREATDGGTLAQVVKSQVIKALVGITDRKSAIRINITEHVAILSMPMWDGYTNFTVTVEDGAGAVVSRFIVSGHSKQWNALGYATAKIASNRAFAAAMESLVERLLAVEFPDTAIPSALVPPGPK